MDANANRTLAGLLLDKQPTSQTSAPPPPPPPPLLSEMSDADQILARVQERRAAIELTPTLCSHCLGGQTGQEFYVEQSGQKGKVMLCRLRCLALWALAQALPK